MNNKEKGAGIGELFDLFSDYLSPADVTAMKIMAQASTAIAKKRLELGMSQSQFADYVGVQQSQVSRWECGDYNFSLRKLAEVASKLDLDIDLTIKPVSDASIETANTTIQSTSFICIVSSPEDSWDNYDLGKGIFNSRSLSLSGKEDKYCVAVC